MKQKRFPTKRDRRLEGLIRELTRTAALTERHKSGQIHFDYLKEHHTARRKLRDYVTSLRDANRRLSKYFKDHP